MPTTSISKALRAAAPWLHWFRGIVLEDTQQSTAACAEYLAYLNVGKEVPPWALRSAVERAVEGNVLLLDAGMRFARLKAKDAKTPAEAEDAAGLLAALVPIAERYGIQRPQLDYEQAEALRKAYILSNSEKTIGRAAPRRNSLPPASSLRGKNSFTGPTKTTGAWPAPLCRRTIERACADDRLFRTRRGSTDESQGIAEPGQQRIHQGAGHGADEKAAPPQAEGATDHGGSTAKNLAHVPATEKAGSNENQSEIAAALRPVHPGETYRYDPSKVQAYLDMLKEYKKVLKDGRSKGPKPQPERLCRLLAAIVASLKTATDSFDGAIALNRDLPEAHRDRGAAYLARCKPSRCWPTSSASTTSSKSCLCGPTEIPLSQDDADKAFDDLDRAFVEGQTEFYDALKEKKKANNDISRADQARKDISAIELGIVNDLAKRYATLGGKPMDSAAKDLENTARIAANLSCAPNPWLKRIHLSR